MGIEGLKLAGLDPTGRSEDKTKALLASVWERSQPVLRARLELLEAAAAAQPLSQALQAEGQTVAHKLSGSLGMFGYMEGTRIAQQIEGLLQCEVADQAELLRLTAQLRLTLFGPK